ncbi:MAG: hypothetical protein KA886_10625 [Candidatus Cloacimonetes bacterium]|nr:hypothetical protein [Candidatus Cloacimonadota bacterium]
MINDTYLCEIVPLLRSGVGDGNRFPMDKSMGYSYHALSGQSSVTANTVQCITIITNGWMKDD